MEPSHAFLLLRSRLGFKIRPRCFGPPYLELVIPPTSVPVVQRLARTSSIRETRGSIPVWSYLFSSHRETSSWCGWPIVQAQKSWEEQLQQRIRLWLGWYTRKWDAVQFGKERRVGRSKRNRRTGVRSRPGIANRRQGPYYTIGLVPLRPWPGLLDISSLAPGLHCTTIKLCTDLLHVPLTLLTRSSVNAKGTPRQLELCQSAAPQ